MEFIVTVFSPNIKIPQFILTMNKNISIRIISLKHFFFLEG